jgi:hypothetical protein
MVAGKYYKVLAFTDWVLLQGLSLDRMDGFYGPCLLRRAVLLLKLSACNSVTHACKFRRINRFAQETCSHSHCSCE